MKVLIWLGLAAFWMGVALLCSGCMVIKSYESGTNADGSTWTKIQFPQGIDLGASMNAVDEVENKRGIQPTESRIGVR